MVPFTLLTRVTGSIVRCQKCSMYLEDDCGIALFINKKTKMRSNLIQYGSTRVRAGFVQNKALCGCGLLGMVGVGQCLDWMILVVFSNFNDAMILWGWKEWVSDWNW